MATITNELSELVTELREINRWYIYQQAARFLIEDLNNVVEEWDAHNWFVVDDEEERDGEAERGNLNLVGLTK